MWAVGSVICHPSLEGQCGEWGRRWMEGRSVNGEGGRIERERGKDRHQYTSGETP